MHILYYSLIILSLVACSSSPAPSMEPGTQTALLPRLDHRILQGEHKAIIEEIRKGCK